MIIDIIEDISYKNLVENQIFEMIEYLLNKGHEFSITANIKGVKFDPDIPKSISKNFPQFTLFSLQNYTYETLVLTETHINFEAGFGAENFGSLVTIPLHAIFQIIIDDSILFINPTATVAKNFLQNSIKSKDENEQQSRSMNAFRMNKNNKDFF